MDSGSAECGRIEGGFFDYNWSVSNCQYGGIGHIEPCRLDLHEIQWPGDGLYAELRWLLFHHAAGFSEKNAVEMGISEESRRRLAMEATMHG
jgi:hypothetical protein